MTNGETTKQRKADKEAVRAITDTQANAMLALLYQWQTEEVC